MRFGEGELLDDFEPVDPALPTRPRATKKTAAAPAPEPEPLPPPVPMMPAKPRQARPRKPFERLKLRPLQQVIRDSTARFMVPCVHR